MTPEQHEGVDLSQVELELTDEDGKVYHFGYEATIPYQGESYVCLVELDPPEEGQEQVLITQVTREGEELRFQVVSDSALVEPVFALFLEQQHHHGGCGCGHEHHHHDHEHGHHHHDHEGCGCGHHHHHDHEHGHHHDHEGCGCGHHHHAHAHDHDHHHGSPDHESEGEKA